jgi:hypothetical protein
MIVPTNKNGIYSFALRGLLEAEKLEGGGGLEEFLNAIDGKYFKEIFESGNSGMTDRLKLVVLALIVFRSFKVEVALNLDQISKNQQLLDTVRETILTLWRMLKTADVITLEEKDIFGSSGVDNPIINLFRHTDKLPRLSRDLFTSVGRKTRYCLKCAKGDSIYISELAWLLWLVFRDGLRNELFAELNTFSIKQLHNNAMFLFDDLGQSFAKPQYDCALADAYEKYLENQNQYRAESV